MIIAFDFETHLIEGCESPKPVCISWAGAFCWDQVEGVAAGKEMEKLAEKLLDLALSDENVHLIGQNLKFDVGVMFHHLPHLKWKIFELYDRGQFHDTMIREQLLELSTTGRINGKSYSMAALLKKYLRIDISDAKEGDDAWRLRYSELEGLPVLSWPKEAYKYALEDAKYTLEIYKKQEQRKRTKGYASIGGEALQVKSDFCLQLITQRGVMVARSKLESVNKQTIEALEPAKKFMIDEGVAYYDSKGNFKKKNKELKKHIAECFPDFIKFSNKAFDKFKQKHGYYKQEALDLFVSGNMSEEVKSDFYNTIGIGGDVLDEIPNSDIIAAWKEYMALEKTLTTYIPRLEVAPTVYPPYRNLKETGRTSSYCSNRFPSLNIQQIPRNGGLREVFIPRAGFTMATIDYSAIELSCVAETMRQLFGSSKMWRLINSGKTPVDMHAYVGAALAGMRHEDFLDLKVTDPKIYKEYRTRGKPIGLGYFGGLGEETMCKVARGQGASMTIDEALEGRKIHAKLFPEIIDYLGWRKCRDGSSHFRAGEPGWVRQQQHSGSRWGYAYETNGRFRYGCTYCSCANGKAMQSLAADGLKEAIFLCVRACEDPKFLGGQLNDSYVIFEIHDEIGFEIKNDNKKELKLQLLADLMIDGMQKVLKTVRITVEGGLQEYWTKDDSKHYFTLKLWKDAKETT